MGQQATDGRPTEGGGGGRRRREGVWEGGRHRREGGSDSAQLEAAKVDNRRPKDSDGEERKRRASGH